MKFLKLAVVIAAIATLNGFFGIMSYAQSAGPVAQPNRAGKTSFVGPIILNLRAGPGPQYPIVDGGPLPSGVGMTILGGQLPWLNVSISDGSGRVGWVNGYYLTWRPVREQVAGNADQPPATPQAVASAVEQPAQPRLGAESPIPAISTLPGAVAQAVQETAVTECGGPTARGFVTEATVIGLSDPVYVLDHSKACANDRTNPCHVGGNCSLDIFANPTGNGYRAVLLTLVRNYKGTRQVDGQTLIYVTKNRDACDAPDGHDCLEALRFDGRKMVPLRISEK
jgi:hypothetical protein